MIGRTVRWKYAWSTTCPAGETTGVDVVPERARDGTVRNYPLKKQVLLTGDRFSECQCHA